MRRQPARNTRTGSPVAKPINWVAPVGGWRTDKPLAELPPNASSTLVNFFPEAGYIRARNGSTTYATGLPGSVGSLIPYSGATNKFFAASRAGIYEITGGGAVSSPLVTGLTSSHFDFAQFTNVGGTWLMAVNGYDAPQIYSGTAWSSATLSGPSNVNNLRGVTAYSSRLWFIEKGTTSLWYLPTSAIQGTLTSVNVGANMKFGGTLIAIETWTCPTASGVMQFLVLMSNQGELIIYQGSDPSNSSAWSLLGTFKLSLPLGVDRSMYQVGGDLAIMTMNGIVPISKAITLDPSAFDQNSMTKFIAPSWRDIVQSVGQSASGWEINVFPQGRMAIVNVPDPALGTYQVVMNTETLAWAKFTGMSATTWAVWNNGLFFGTSGGTVCQADYGSNDLGSEIDCLSVGAWSRLSDGLASKQASLIGVDVLYGPSVSIYAGASFDYAATTPARIASGGNAQTNVADWDVALWDQATWSGEVPSRILSACDGIGKVFAPTILAVVNGSSGSPSDCKIIGGALYVMPAVSEL